MNCAVQRLCRNYSALDAGILQRRFHRRADLLVIDLDDLAPEERAARLGTTPNSVYHAVIDIHIHTSSTDTSESPIKRSLVA
jgi:hypothetical protein